MTLDSAEADELAARLSRLTGEPIEIAVTNALRERLARQMARSGPMPGSGRDVAALAARLRQNYDTRPLTADEWDAAGGGR